MIVLAMVHTSFATTSEESEIKVFLKKIYYWTGSRPINWLWTRKWNNIDTIISKNYTLSILLEKNYLETMSEVRLSGVVLDTNLNIQSLKKQIWIICGLVTRQSCEHYWHKLKL